MPMVLELMGGGHAYGTGSVSVARAETSQQQPVSDSRLNASDIRNGSLGIQWNITALNSQLAVDQQYDPSVRAKQLDREIKRAAISGVFHHNVQDVFSDKLAVVSLIGAGVDAWWVTETSKQILEKNYPELVWGLSARVAALSGVVRAIKAGATGVAFRDQIVDPLFLTARPTRAAIAAGCLASGRLVRPAPLG